MSTTPVRPMSAEAERERLLHEHLPQVRFIALSVRQRLPNHVELDDLIGAGYVGLMDAVAKFDPAKNIKFKSYAHFRIRGAILDSLRDLDWGSRDTRRKARQLEGAHARLTAELGRPATEDEVAQAVGLQVAELRGLLNDLRGLEIGSLESVSADGTEAVVDYIPDPGGDALGQCLEKEFTARLAQAIHDLPQREREVMSLYYFEELSMKEVGEVMGIVESRVSQLHTMAVLRLRAALDVVGADKPRQRRAAVPISAGKRRSRPKAATRRA